MKKCKGFKSVRALFVGGLLSSLLLILGCGGEGGTMSGVIKYKGMPLKGGAVVFITPTKNVRGDIDENGRYKVENVPLGEATVTVDTESLKPVKTPKLNTPPKGVEPPVGYKAPNSQADRYVPIPKEYRDPKTTKLKVTVTGGHQEQDLTLE